MWLSSTLTAVSWRIRALTMLLGLLLLCKLRILALCMKGHRMEIHGAYSRPLRVVPCQLQLMLEIKYSDKSLHFRPRHQMHAYPTARIVGNHWRYGHGVAGCRRKLYARVT